MTDVLSGRRSNPWFAPDQVQGSARPAVRRWRTWRLAVLLISLLACVVAAVFALRPRAHELISGNAKAMCAYSDNSVALLHDLEAATGANYRCVMVFNNANPDWGSWDTPWFISNPPGDAHWADWVGEHPGRQLIITQSMVPFDAPSDWRHIGAGGGYNRYAAVLARQLVVAGLGHSVIRLGAEANDPESRGNSIGNSQAEHSDWARYWTQIVTTMRAVPGAHFTFDWSINEGYQNLPLTDWYPGNSVVNIIGIDAYDSGISGSYVTADARWLALYYEPDGIAAVAAFARAHGKPLSIPEWGLVPTTNGGAGDDAAYVAGIASVMASNKAAYESYFYHPGLSGLLMLPQAPRALKTYQHCFLHATGC